MCCGKTKCQRPKGAKDNPKACPPRQVKKCHGSAGGELVVYEATAAVGLNEAGVLQHAQVLRHRAVRYAEEVRQGPYAQCASGQQAHNLEALVNRKRPEYPNHVPPFFP